MKASPLTDHPVMARVIDRAREVMPGLTVVILVGFAAQFVANHYNAPAMLMALLFGIALNFLSEEGKCIKGIEFSAKTVLRFGVALLGLRISADMIASLGWAVIALVVLGVVLTIFFGLWVGRFFGHGPRFSFLTAGAVAICGASAAMAIAAILPQDERSEQRLIFTVVSVTLLSTLAMIIYPILAQFIGFDEQAMGVFLGATIHDVAQVVGAGFSVSENVGETATLIKLFRVALLAPVVVIGTLVVRAYTTTDPSSSAAPPILPSFVIGFVVLAVLNSTVAVPDFIKETMASLSRWALLSAIAGVGMKTALKKVLQVGGPAIALVVVETLFIGGFIALALLYLPL